jgi:arsenate reductase
MMDEGIDISQNPTKSVFDLVTQGRKYDAVITVCDGASAERCPVFPGLFKRFHWSFTDPSSFTGTHEEILAKTAEVRDAIKSHVGQFIDDAKDYAFWER